MKKAIIFGITGQDGSHLADLLLSKNYEVVGAVRRTSTDNTSRIKHILRDERFTLEECDITDAHSVYSIIKKHDDASEVYNLAAQSFVASSFKQPGLTWDATAKGCMNILEAMITFNIYGRFYQASSSEMYGSAFTWLPDSVFPKIDQDLSTKYGREVLENHIGLKFQDEDTKFLPQSPYAIAKCAAHYMTRLYRQAYGLHASCGILFNHEGPRRGEQFVTRKITKWIGDFIKWSSEYGQRPADLISYGEPASQDKLFVRDSTFYYPKLRLGNIDASRDWGYAGDFCEAMWLMLQQEEPDDYVICTEETHTVREFLEEAFSLVSLDWQKYVYIDPELYRPAEVDFLKGNCSKAKTVLNWQPKHSFKDLVKIMVDCDVN